MSCRWASLAAPRCCTSSSFSTAHCNAQAVSAAPAGGSETPSPPATAPLGPKPSHRDPHLTPRTCHLLSFRRQSFLPPCSFSVAHPTPPPSPPQTAVLWSASPHAPSKGQTQERNHTVFWLLPLQPTGDTGCCSARTQVRGVKAATRLDDSVPNALSTAAFVLNPVHLKVF